MINWTPETSEVTPGNAKSSNIKLIVIFPLKIVAKAGLFSTMTANNRIL
jgi:hypothetical protein